MLRLQTEYGASRQTGLDSNSASFRGGRLLFQFLAVMFSQLGNLRLDHHSAVGLTTILCVIVLVIILSFVELAVRHDVGNNRLLPDLRLVELLNHLATNLFLLRVMMYYLWAIRGS